MSDHHGSVKQIASAVALGAWLLFLAIAAPSFYQPQPLLSLVTREAPTLVVACGMALVIICRQIDVSVGSQFGACSVCAGLVTTHGAPLPVALIASIATGALLGALNPIAILPAGLFFGFLETGALAMQRAVGVPSPLVSVIQGLTMIFILSAMGLSARRPKA